MMHFTPTLQPLKAIFTIFTILKEILLLALYCVKFIPQRLRQHPSYSHRQAIGIALLRAWFSYASTVEFHFPLSLEPSKEKERQALIDPAPMKMYRTPLDHASITPARIGASWFPHAYHNSSTDDSQQRVILHFHGGAYVVLGARDSDVQTGQKVITEGLKSLAFFPQYRLSSHANCAFPAALQDAVSAYKYLLDMDIPPTTIIFSGDSAGGNLVLALLRYINQHGDLLPLPAAALLWSPWVDIAADYKELAKHRNSSTDWVPTRVVEWRAKVYSQDTPKEDPYISPARHIFQGGVPLFVSVGTNEILYDSIKAFAKDMATLDGNDVHLAEINNGPHDVMLAGGPLGFMDEAMEGARQALEWLKQYNI